MARKKELMELENPSMEGNIPVDAAGTEAGIFSGEEDGTPSETGGDGMDLNELLGSMDQEPSENPGLPNGELPELTEEEMFGESPEDTAGPGEEKPESVPSHEAGSTASKARRTTRRKKEETPEGSAEETDTGKTDLLEIDPDNALPSQDIATNTDKNVPAEGADEMGEITPREDGEATGAREALLPSGEDASGTAAPSAAAPARRTVVKNRKEDAPVLTLEVRGEVETEESREDAIWHEIHNAYRTRRILTGQLGGIEQTDNGKTITIVDYKGFRIVIPLKEMMINVGRSPSGQEYAELMLRQNKILGNMLGAEIDFIVKGIDSKTRSVVASRKEAMLRKRQIFYLDTDAAGMYRVYEGRIAQARVIAVAEKVIRVEVFGGGMLHHGP